MEVFDNSKWENEFEKINENYDKLGMNLVQALAIFLKEKGLNYLSINYRVKEKANFIEKIGRKKYKNPFEEIEDICGIRIICYYQTDVSKISEIIESEFSVVENQDKEELLNDDQFGYRSNHFIVKIKEEWATTPNYRGLNNFKAEIQVRTILMHAWAEIEHKLSYKSESQIPKQFRRKLFIMSAKLEEADEQFEGLRVAVNEYKENVIKLSKESNDLTNVDLNLDSLQAFLDANFPDRLKSLDNTASLLDQLQEFNLTLADLIKGLEIVEPYIEEIERELFPENNGTKSWAQTGIAREILDLTNDDWRENRGIPLDSIEIDRTWASYIKEQQNR